MLGCAAQRRCGEQHRDNCTPSSCIWSQTPACIAHPLPHISSNSHCTAALAYLRQARLVPLLQDERLGKQHPGHCHEAGQQQEDLRVGRRAKWAGA